MDPEMINADGATVDMYCGETKALGNTTFHNPNVNCQHFGCRDTGTCLWASDMENKGKYCTACRYVFLFKGSTKYTTQYNSSIIFSSTCIIFSKHKHYNFKNMFWSDIP